MKVLTRFWRGCVVFLGVLTGVVVVVRAADGPPRPLKALLVTGGCCHNYAEQAAILTSTTASNALPLGVKIAWTVAHQGGKNTYSKIALFENPNWADGYDVVLHNYCLPDIADAEWVGNVIRPHFQGVPAVVLHCAVQSFRRTALDDWAGFIGVVSSRNEPSRMFDIQAGPGAHPILKGFPRPWRTPVAEELYLTTVRPTAVALASARGVESAADNACVWVNQFGKGRVFGLSTGHSSKTFADLDYSVLITRGLLWAAARLEVPRAGPVPERAPPAQCPP